MKVVVTKRKKGAWSVSTQNFTQLFWEGHRTVGAVHLYQKVFALEDRGVEVEWRYSR